MRATSTRRPARPPAEGAERRRRAPRASDEAARRDSARSSTVARRPKHPWEPHPTRKDTNLALPGRRGGGLQASAPPETLRPGSILRIGAPGGSLDDLGVLRAVRADPPTRRPLAGERGAVGVDQLEFPDLVSRDSIGSVSDSPACRSTFAGGRRSDRRCPSGRPCRRRSRDS
jgi:hypothetical protein